MGAEGDGDRGPLRDALLSDLVRRQPLLAVINTVTALLFTSGFATSAPTPVLAAWLGYMTLSQVARVLCWRYLRNRPAAPHASVWLVTTSALAGAGWGAIGILFFNLGLSVQQMLVPFFLAGMAAGSVVSLGAHPPAFFAFAGPTLLPYAAHHAWVGGPAARTMALTTLAYAVGLSAVAYQVYHSLRRLIELHLENSRLVVDLRQARERLEQLLEPFAPGCERGGAYDVAVALA